MSTLTLHIGRSIGATLGPRDEIVVTTLDHEANVSTWKAMAADRGVTVHQVDIRPDDVTLDLEDLESKLGPRTRLVAVGYASNAVGTVNPVKAIIERAHEVGALTYVDAVAYAPHGPIDVRELDTDFLATSVYKWFGPHLGALYGKAEAFDRPAGVQGPAGPRPVRDRDAVVRIDRRRARGDRLPARRRTGVRRRDRRTGRRRRERAAARARRRRWSRSPTTSASSSRGSSTASSGIPSVTIHGITDPARFAAERVPTVSISIDGVHPHDAAETLGRAGIYVWDGDFYATEPHRGARQGRDRRRPADRARPLQHRRRGRPDARGRRGHRRGMTEAAGRPTIQARLARGFDPAELRRIKRLWVRHSIAEDRRDIDGLIATLAPDCVYEIVVTGQRWEGHDGARAFYTELFAAFPDNAFALSEIVVGPQGVFEVATLTGTNQGPWAGAPPSGLPVSLEVIIFFPWDPAHGAVPRGADLVRPRRCRSGRTGPSRPAEHGGATVDLCAAPRAVHHRGGPADDRPHSGDLHHMTRTSRAAIAAALLSMAWSSPPVAAATHHRDRDGRRRRPTPTEATPVRRRRGDARHGRRDPVLRPERADRGDPGRRLVSHVLQHQRQEEYESIVVTQARDLQGHHDVQRRRHGLDSGSSSSASRPGWRTAPMASSSRSRRRSPVRC